MQTRILCAVAVAGGRFPGVIIGGLAISGAAWAQQSDIGPLQIERIGPASALLTWPDDPETFLQESSDLGWLNDWSPSLLSPLVRGGEKSVVVPLVDAARP